MCRNVVYRFNNAIIRFIKFIERLARFIQISLTPATHCYPDMI